MHSFCYSSCKISIVKLQHSEEDPRIRQVSPYIILNRLRITQMLQVKISLFVLYVHSCTTNSNERRANSLPAAYSMLEGVHEASLWSQLLRLSSQLIIILRPKYFRTVIFNLQRDKTWRKSLSLWEEWKTETTQNRLALRIVCNW